MRIHGVALYGDDEGVQMLGAGYVWMEWLR